MKETGVIVKVFYVTAWFPNPENNAITPFVKRDVTALGNDNDLVLVHIDRSYSGRPYRFWVSGKIRAVRLPAHSILQVTKLPFRLRRLSRGCDLLHSTGVFALLTLAISFIPLPWVHTEHWSKYMEGGLLPLVISVFERFPDQVTTVSSFLEKKISGYGVKHVKTVHNIVPLPQSVTTSASSDTMRLISIGSLINRKSPDVAVRTLRVLLDRGIDASLVWVGDGPLRQEVDNLINELELSERVTLTGNVKPELVFEYLSGANIFLLPTQAETFCLGAAEALAAGLPVVLGGNGGQRDYVKPPYGILVDDSRNPEAYADAVIEQMENSRERTGGFFQEAVREFSEIRFADRMNEIYRNLYVKFSTVKHWTK